MSAIRTTATWQEKETRAETEMRQEMHRTEIIMAVADSRAMAMTVAVYAEAV